MRRGAAGTNARRETSSKPGPHASRKGAAMISIVVPAYNEERNLDVLYRARQRAHDGASACDWEIVIVDDGSTDGTWRPSMR